MLGIYAIIHRSTGKKYVGQSVNVEARFAAHKRSLNRGRHHSTLLQQAWDACGADEFEFVVLEQCEADRLTEREQAYLDQRPEFNIALFAETAPMLGRSHTEATRAKMRLRVHNKETRLKMSKAWENRENKSPNKGAVRTTETRAKISAALKGRPLSEETKAKMSAVRKGRRNSAEAAAKVSASKLGVPNVKVRKEVRCVETGQAFDSVKSASEFFGGGAASLTAHLKGRRPRFKGLTFEYTNQKQLRG